MHKIFITGGCGFIGSHLTEYFFKKYKNSKIYVYDKITYAASVKNLKDILKSKRLKIIKKDLINYKALKYYSKNTDLFIHAAAESHVDNSFNLTNEFIKTNVIGTKNVLDACKTNNIKKLIHISTDEVYGEIYKSSFSENSKFNPSNPYSSSKAAAEMIINGYIHSYKLPVIIIRANNIFGTRQHPEKLLPGSCWSLIKKKKFTIHGNGTQKRSFLYVKDLCEGVYTVVSKGKNYNIYNIGSKFEYKNIDVFKLVANENNLKFNNYINYVKDRPFNDYRYSLNFKKIMKLGWKPKTKIEDKISEINNWYKKNISRFKKR
mgnify:CR=1 FL=1|tara:strand:+ start:618 stop:1574 length:957 start_codon:yes stop_codon:yes gene_type:complete